MFVCLGLRRRQSSVENFFSDFLAKNSTSKTHLLRQYFANNVIENNTYFRLQDVRQTDVNHCVRNPCKWGGICLSTDAGPICQCRNIRYRGRHCEIGRTGDRPGVGRGGGGDLFQQMQGHRADNAVC